jgi:iron complex transport system permease protein
VVPGSACLLAVAIVASLAIGPTGVSLRAIPSAFSAFWGWTDDPLARSQSLVLMSLRLPRTLLGLFVGAALATAGAMLQGLFRNPLADPGIIGVSSGGALAAITTIAVGNSLVVGWSRLLGAYALPISAFLGSFLTTALLVAVASRRGQIATGTLLLTGIAFAAITGAVSGVISFASDDRELRDLTLWSMGSLAGASWPKLIALIPFAVLLISLVPTLTRALNGLLLGEADAFHLGIDTESAKRRIVFATAAAVGAAVAVAGLVGFVGLVVPHIIRLISGPDHRVVLPAGALIGGALVITADTFARMVVAPAELPLGIVMALIGAPVFLHLVLRRGVGGIG